MILDSEAPLQTYRIKIRVEGRELAFLTLFWGVSKIWDTAENLKQILIPVLYSGVAY